MRVAGGFYAGIGWGAVVSVVVAGGASLLAELPNAQGPDSATVEVPAGSQFDSTRSDTPAVLPMLDTVSDAAQSGQETAGVSRVVAPTPDDLVPMAGADTTSGTQPDTGTADSAMNAPQSGAAPQVDVTAETPVAPTTQNAGSALPEVVNGDEALSISTDPAQPMPPDVPQIGSTESVFSGSSFGGDTTEDAPDMPAAQTAPENIGSAVVDVQPVQPQQPLMEALEVDTSSAPQMAVVPAQSQKPTVEAAMAEPEMAEPGMVENTTEEVPVVASAAPTIAPPAMPSVIPSVQPAAVPVPQDEPEIEIAAVSKPFQNLAPNVATNRLPSLGASTPAAVSDTAESDMSAADTADLSPIERFAIAFENPDKKPLMAIVLIDDGSSPIGLEALTAFPYPISFAVDTAWDGAAGAMADYRAAGFEVLALVDLASEATGQDAEINMAVKLRAVPEAVAIMEGADTGIQGNRAVSDQVTAIAQASGLGLVLFPKGLNTAQKLAVKAGVPAAVVFRDFDAKGQNAKAIRRFLDHAAFKAGQQDGGVIMVGRLRADTISALLLWGLQDRANRVALAPVSAVLIQK